MSQLKVIGFIGLGQMGGSMAKNILKKATSSKLLVLDANKKAMDQLKSLDPARIEFADSPAELARKSDAVVTMLPSSPHVHQVFLGSKGLVEGANEETILIDSSTIDPNISKNVSKELMKLKGVRAIVDAPVSGGTLGAAAGTLTFMVGGSDSDFQLSRPILEYMGKNLVHCGAHDYSGHGQIAKLCNNMLLGITMLGTSEALNLGIRMGMDPKILSNIIATSTGRNWSLDTYNPVPGVLENAPSSRNYEGGFGIKLMSKDLKLAAEAASKSGSTVFLGDLAKSLYSLAGQSNVKDISGKSTSLGDKDFSSIYQWISSADKQVSK